MGCGEGRLLRADTFYSRVGGQHNWNYILWLALSLYLSVHALYYIIIYLILRVQYKERGVAEEEEVEGNRNPFAVISCVNSLI